MDRTTQSARAIRADILQLNRRYEVVTGGMKCQLCSYPLLTRAFYIFPCTHAFHKDCCVNEVRGCVAGGSENEGAAVMATRLTPLTSVAFLLSKGGQVHSALGAEKGGADQERASPRPHGERHWRRRAQAARKRLRFGKRAAGLCCFCHSTLFTCFLFSPQGRPGRRREPGLPLVRRNCHSHHRGAVYSRGSPAAMAARIASPPAPRPRSLVWLSFFRRN